jgi:hypothetical protein
MTMAGSDDVLARLRVATPSECSELAKILGVELRNEPDEVVVRLADAYRSAASEKEYRKILVGVAEAAANSAEWKLEEVSELAESSWIEDYIYVALGFVHRPDRKSLSDHDKAKERARAEEALQGKLPPAQHQADVSLAGLAGSMAVSAGLWFFFGLWAAVPLVAVGVLGWLLGPSMKKVVPATLLLIHVRKRLEFEAVLKGSEAAA